MRYVCFIMLFMGAAAMADEPVWHDFDFGVSDALGFGKERVALLLRARIDAADCHVQLDTGAGETMMWHSKGAAGAGARPRRVTVQIGDVKKEIDADEANLAALGNERCAGVAATVGNGFFDHGTLTIDLKGERFAFAPGSGLGARADAPTMRYLRSGGAGLPLVEVVLDNGRRGQALLDTGAARFALVATSAAQWSELSGGLALTDTSAVRSFNATNVKDSTPSQCFDTLVAGRMSVGGRQLRQTMVSYCQGKDFHLDEPIIGVLGLLPLAGHRIVLDYVAQRWLLTD